MAKRETSKSRPVNLGRHKRNCTICTHPNCEEIEQDFINWKSPAAITTEYGLADRTTVYRHAHALDLFIKRGRNVRAALEKIIERVGDVQGQWIDRSEYIDLNALFERMSKDELEVYARDGKLPDWFTQTLSGALLPATAGDSEETKNVQ